IVLGCLIGATFIAGLIKLAWNKRKLKKETKKAELEASLRSDKQMLVGKGAGEGDLFGVRSIEHAYLGAGSQSRPISPTPSYVLSPNTPIVDWSNGGRTGGHSPSSSTLSLPRSLAPSSLNHTKRKPSPLGLHPPRSEPSNVGGIGGSYLPPLPSPRSQNSLRSVSPTASTFQEEEAPGWVSPLDVHFSRSSTPKERPTSYLPKLQFPVEIERMGLFVPSPSNSVRHIKSESASIMSTNASIATPPAVRRPSRGPKSPMLSVFPSTAHPMPSRAVRGGSRSIFPINDEQDRPSPSNGQWDPSLPTFPGPVHCIDDPTPSGPIIRDSVVSKQRVSVVFQPPHVRDSSVEGLKSHTRGHSPAASSIYSTTTSILEPSKDAPPTQHSRTRSRSISALPKPQTRSSRSTSTSQPRSASLHTITRTRDSIRRRDRMPSSEILKNRRSRDRDQMHYDPSATNRTRAGSVQGRQIDFDSPRESPFSNANAIHHSRNSSISATSSRSS
ncbi:hypothetical protein BKA65DRAFT_574808, partial [Rhexocercosporidium sp. MPI-PUGE-AT-0058]